MMNFSNVGDPLAFRVLTHQVKTLMYTMKSLYI